MRSISALLRTFIVLTIVTGLTSAIAAYLAKGRMSSRGTPTDDEIELVTIYDSSSFASTAGALRRVAVTAWYGGGTLDLRAATLDPAGAHLTLRAIFAGYRLVVPETWRVELKSIGIFGGIGDGRNQDRVEPNGPLLVIDGLAIFGGFGIVADAPDLDVAQAPVAALEGLAAPA